MTMHEEQQYEDANGVAPPAGATNVTQGLATREVAMVTETASAAAAALAVAGIQAKHAIAKKFPRVIDDVRRKLITACERPRFAEAARYRKPMGKKKNEETGRYEQAFIEGPSIRFVEECLRLMGNAEVVQRTTYDDAAKRNLDIAVIDFETNAGWGVEITIEKTVERRAYNAEQERDLARSAIRTRRNSYGDLVYILAATDDEIATKQAAAVSKAARTIALRLIPADLVEEGQDTCVATMRNKDAKDPTAARKELVDRFALIGVKAADLMEYLGGRSLDAATPDQIVELRIIGASIKAGEGVWKDYLAASPYVERPAEAEKSPEASKAAAIRADVEAKKKQAQAKKAEKEQAKKGKPGPAPTASAAPSVDPNTGEVTGEPGFDPSTGELPPDQQGGA